tara:strand:- start:3783 stop:3974 length:192 start_codon:yes stop_codon:yes gene_type:complete
MGHMNWISTLTADDIQVMKVKTQFLTDSDNVIFQDQKYTVSYLKAVIKVWETNIIDPELLDNV